MGDSTKKETVKKTSFFKGLKKEFRKVTWPNKQELTKETVAVVIISAIVGVVIAFMDMLIQYGVEFLTKL